MATSALTTPLQSLMHPGEPNVGIGERGLSVVVGLSLAAAAARPRPNPLLNLAALGIGAYLAYRGATGYCPVKAAAAATTA